MLHLSGLNLSYQLLAFEYVSREKLSEFKQGNPITDELVDKIDMLFERYGLPPSKQFDNLFL